MNQRPGGRLSIAMMIETVLLGGAEMVMLQLCEELRSRGHLVTPVIPAAQQKQNWLREKLAEGGFVAHEYEVRRAIDPGFARRLARDLSELSVDVIHSHEFVMAVYGAATARRLGVPHVITMHGNMNMTRKWRRRAALRWAFRKSDAVVAVSRDTQRHLEQSLGLKQGVVQVVQNGIPVRTGDRVRVRRELDLADDELLLLAVGSLMPRKGHAVLIDALARLPADLPVRWRLAIAGWGAERPRLEEAIERHGLTGRVHLLGPRDDVPDLLAAADVFVMPSLWEGLPLAIVEAMFARKPIIASRTSGIPEALDDGDTGLLTAPGDADSLRDALLRVMIDAPLRARLGERAAAEANRRFTIDVMGDAYERLYRREAALPATALS